MSVLEEFYSEQTSYAKTSFISILAQYGIDPTAQYGQNFIWNLNLLDGFTSKAKIKATDNILEIGAGAGTFSYVLAQKAQKVVAIEIDPQLQPLLTDLEKLTASELRDLTFVGGDACVLDWQSLFTPAELDNSFLVSNLPYNLMTELITKAIREFHQARGMLFLVETNASPRILGKAGDGKSSAANQGFLYKLISTYGQVRKLQHISRANFYPQPHVDSDLLLLEAAPESFSYQVLAEFPEYLAKTIKIAYSQRRKTLVNCFKKYQLDDGVRDFIASSNLAANVRAEELSADDFARLCLYLKDNLGGNPKNNLEKV